MSTIAILGSGRVATRIAAGLAKAGHPIIIGVRDAGKAQAVWQGPNVAFMSHEQAIGAADVIFNATPGETSLERMKAMAGALTGKLLIDVANATARDEAGHPAGLLYPDDSLGERLQMALPATRVVKTLNTMLAPVMSDPASLAASPSVFLSGNDAEAKATVRSLLADLGWQAGSMIDLGDITSARGPEAVMLMVPNIIAASGVKPFAVSVVM